MTSRNPGMNALANVASAYAESLGSFCWTPLLGWLQITLTSDQKIRWGYNVGLLNWTKRVNEETRVNGFFFVLLHFLLLITWQFELKISHRIWQGTVVVDKERRLRDDSLLLKKHPAFFLFVLMKESTAPWLPKLNLHGLLFQVNRSRQPNLTSFLIGRK